MKYFSIGQQKILFVLALLTLTAIYFKFYYHPSSSSEEIIKEWVIEVSGEVGNPGIYIFQNTPTLKDAIDRAGGFKETTQLDAPSSSEVLESGTLLTILKDSPKFLPIPPHLSPLPHGKREQGEGPLLKESMEEIKQHLIRIKIGRMEANKLLVFSIPLDLNRVSIEDLCLIPGIGESLAREIVTYRERRKRFRSVEELKNVKGIGEKKYESFKTFFIIRH
ncbi:MAG: helix-hairpin-helix domain-containing protein [Thermodesulfobacteriota bacterium]|nr:helix-hairpin-helix domain-containing protein [Thermodesulfobacteriota bacterium]